MKLTLKRSSEIDLVQSNEYKFPYHYIPNLGKFPNFCRKWDFSPSYIASINLFFDWMKSLEFKKKHKHMDFGCGDGGFVNNIQNFKEFKSISFYGIDIDENAIKWANIFSQKKNNFFIGKIENLKSNFYHSGSLIEVYEHIPPRECPSFLKSISNSLKVGAELFITVPSTELPISKKHYRHFDFSSIKNEFEKYFKIKSMYGFEKRSFLTKLINKLFVTKNWYLETVFSNNFLIRNYSTKQSKLRNCGRIMLIATKK